jgi:hypothetical protein
MDGSRASHDILKGYDITVGVMVDGLAAESNAGDRIEAAEAAAVGVMGGRGSACPGLSVTTYCKNIRVESVSDTAAKVYFTYGGYTLPRYSFRTQLNMVQSNLDYAGKVIKRQYRYPLGYMFGEAMRGKLVTTGARLMRPCVESVHTARFTLTTPTTFSPAGMGTLGGVSGYTLLLGFVPTANGTLTGSTVTVSARTAMSYLNAYAGCINSTAYQMGVQYGVPGQWLISNVSGDSPDGDVTFEAEMTFHFKENGWPQLITFDDPGTGLPPHDLIESKDVISAGGSIGAGGTITNAGTMTLPTGTLDLTGGTGTQSVIGSGTEQGYNAVPFPILTFGGN